MENVCILRTDSQVSGGRNSLIIMQDLDSDFCFTKLHYFNSRIMVYVHKE